MSVVPEIILQRAIIDGWLAIRKDPRIINMIFKNLPAAQQEEVKDYILKSVVDFSINYPKDVPKIPAMVLLMKTEQESQEFLNDIMGTSPNYNMPEDDMTTDMLGGGFAASTSGMAGLPRKWLGPLNVLGMDPLSAGSGINFQDQSKLAIQEVFSADVTWPSLRLHVIAGTGKGQTYLISSITDERLDIDGTFSVQLDSTSVVEIREASDPEAVYGEPVPSYQSSASLTRLGANYDAQYQLDIVAGNQNEVIYLYTVLKAILFARRKFLEAQGIMSLKISGSDLAPRTEFLPAEYFSRSMTLQFTYPFNFIVENDVAKAIEVTLISVNPQSAVPIPGDEIIVSRIEL